jgi:NAD-dependent deacetylase
MPIADLHRLDAALDAWSASGRGAVLVLTGAGISAESGIPTFRGADGYWTIGSRNYRPADFATRAAFEQMPERVWRFYLERIVRHRDARPNPGHRALVALEEGLGDRFLLVTQNVDGLHRRAGNSERRTYRIHGDLGQVRCAGRCADGPRPLPAAVLDLEAAALAAEPADLAADLRAALTCATCGAWLRPHVLWFDECYDEDWFHFDSTLAAAGAAGLLCVIGTSGATNLPDLVVRRVDARGAPMVVVGLDDSPFSERAAASPRGAFVRGSAGLLVPRIVEGILRRESAA